VHARLRCLPAIFAALCWTAALHAATTITCDVAIIGGGPGGVHTAYKLTKQHLTTGTVCLFEMSDHLGGRVGNNYPVGFSGQAYVNNGVPVQNSGQMGTGGYRMYFNQYTYTLGQELAALGQPGQLTFQAQNSFSRLSAVVNQNFDPKFPDPIYFTYNNGGVAKHFAPLYNSPINDNDIWKVLLCGPQVTVDKNSTPQYAKMAIPGLSTMSTAGYLQWVAKNVISSSHGPEVAQYLLDTWRFRGDFDSPNDVVSYLEFTAKDYTGGLVIYPIPSFQPYFDIMKAQIIANGGRVYLEEKILSLNRSGAGYVLTTGKNNTVIANSVVIATTHNALDASKGGMTGNVLSDIIAQPQYQYIQSTDSVTVTNQFGDGLSPNTGWWNGNINYPTGPNLLGPQLSPSANPLRRSTNNIMIPGDLLPGCVPGSSCDFRNTKFFNNTNELPLTDYHNFINVTRTVYNDKRDAVANWMALYNAGEALLPNGGGNAAVNKQILKSLRYMYPTVFNGTATEPAILKTQVTPHLPAWYNLKQGALAQSITNDSLFGWSLKPLPSDRVYLVGDTWRPDQSGWSEGAYKGSIYVLNKYFGANIDPKEESMIKCVRGDIVDPN
jgi:hypothetical protein